MLPSHARSELSPRVLSEGHGPPAARPAAAARADSHVGSHSRYSAGCRCAACTAAHAAYLVDWRAGRIRRFEDAAPVRAHLQRLVASGLVLGYLADEAGVPRRTVYELWHGRRRITPETAAALLELRPLRVAAALPTPVQERDALADSVGDRPARRRAVAALVLRDRPAGAAAAELGVSARTVQRWRAAVGDGAGPAAGGRTA